MFNFSLFIQHFCCKVIVENGTISLSEESANFRIYQLAKLVASKEAQRRSRRRSIRLWWNTNALPAGKIQIHVTRRKLHLKVTSSESPVRKFESATRLFPLQPAG